jgi:uncharacterized protein (DUF433 family)
MDRTVRYGLEGQRSEHEQRKVTASVTTIETRYEHVVLLDGRVPQIAGTTMQVVELVTAQQAHGWSPEELAFQFPHLTLGQIHSVLA